MAPQRGNRKKTPQQDAVVAASASSSVPTAAASTMQASTLQENPARESQQPLHCRPLHGFEQTERVHRSFLVSCHGHGYLRGIPLWQQHLLISSFTTAAAEQTVSAPSECGVLPSTCPRSGGPHEVICGHHRLSARREADQLPGCIEGCDRRLSFGFPATLRVRGNFRCYFFAVDTHPTADLPALLLVGNIYETEVRAKQVDLNSCVGMVFGVDPAIPYEYFADNIASPMPLVFGVRRGTCLSLTFTGTTIPLYIVLYKQKRPVRPRPRPMQCSRCDRFGHATATCSEDEQCLRCGIKHAPGLCAAHPHCINCRVKHPTTKPLCPARQLHRRAGIIMTSSDGIVADRQALQHTRTPGRNISIIKGRSSRDALAGTGNMTSEAAPRPTTSAPVVPTKMTTAAPSCTTQLVPVAVPKSTTTEPATWNSHQADTKTRNDILTGLPWGLQMVLKALLVGSHKHNFCVVPLLTFESMADLFGIFLDEPTALRGFFPGPCENVHISLPSALLLVISVGCVWHTGILIACGRLAFRMQFCLSTFLFPFSPLPLFPIPPSPAQNCVGALI
ncbi:hypothetical protein HPB51_001455 [Rhipicephalus microplus]|uniref:Tick transposon n=1 Tax=Rhipicephalus microplus TaxID=6941 RepID=A0A9J6EF64_RHIMP|nr:hypothetical protein HPB51_001455 [Rhipicephalus microplus]